MRGHSGAFIHETAIVESGATVGEGSQVWHHCHIRSGAWIGAKTNLGKDVYVDDGAVIGDGCKIQNNVSVYRGVTLGNNVFVGPSAVFTNDLHPRAAAENWDLATTRVGEGATIGANSTVVAGITIGPWAMIGAGSVVVGDVGPHSLVVGNPARQIGWVCACGQVLQRGVETFVAQYCSTCGRSSQPGL